MELHVLDVPRAEAARRYATLAGQAQADVDLSSYDRAMVAACEEVLAGRQIVDMAACVRTGGTMVVETWASFWDREMQGHRSEVGPVLVPRIAIARSDLPYCWTRPLRQDGRVVFQSATGFMRSRPRKGTELELASVFDQRAEYRVHRRRRPHHELLRRAELRALVPVCPPELRPEGDPAEFLTLFEAEWSEVAPGDPALLKPLGGNLASVICTWDLSELEKAVLESVR